MAQSVAPEMGMPSARTTRWIGLFAVAALYALPILIVVISSFKTNADIQNYPLSFIFKPTLEAYQAVLTPGLLTALGNSAVITVIATAAILIASVPLAYALTRLSRRWAGVSIGILIALQMVPPAIAVIPLYGLLPQLGLIGTLPGVALSIAASTVPYATLLLRPFYLAVPSEVIEAAAVDGAGPLRSFWSICLPLVRNGILVITILVFIGAWGEFLYAISFLSEQGLYPLSVLLVQQQGQYGTAYNNMMALGIIGAVPTIVLFLLAARKLTSGLSLGVGK
ncbi:MAG: carbohydrate ABC transporter permease [Propionicimonas sp.]|nr:carbohydrate ABC transporter permease [Propionicimonas sp.]